MSIMTYYSIQYLSVVFLTCACITDPSVRADDPAHLWCYKCSVDGCKSVEYCSSFYGKDLAGGGGAPEEPVPATPSAPGAPAEPAVPGAPAAAPAAPAAEPEAADEAPAEAPEDGEPEAARSHRKRQLEDSSEEAESEEQDSKLGQCLVLSDGEDIFESLCVDSSETCKDYIEKYSSSLNETIQRNIQCKTCFEDLCNTKDILSGAPSVKFGILTIISLIVHMSLSVL